MDQREVPGTCGGGRLAVVPGVENGAPVAGEPIIKSSSFFGDCPEI